MSTWRTKKQPGEPSYCDNVEREVPACGTVACIGGSLAVLKKTKATSDRYYAKLLGLTPAQVNGLFYHWEPTESGWPEKYAKEFKDADNVLDKAKVAVRLLREVVKTNGACLNVEKSNG